MQTGFLQNVLRCNNGASSGHRFSVQIALVVEASGFGRSVEGAKVRHVAYSKQNLCKFTMHSWQARRPWMHIPRDLLLVIFGEKRRVTNLSDLDRPRCVWWAGHEATHVGILTLHWHYQWSPVCLAQSAWYIDWPTCAITRARIIC